MLPANWSAPGGFRYADHAGRRLQVSRVPMFRWSTERVPDVWPPAARRRRRQQPRPVADVRPGHRRAPGQAHRGMHDTDRPRRVVGEDLCGRQRRVGQEDAELVTAEARRDGPVDLASEPLEHAGDTAQQRVARRMPVAVIDQLELIEVAHQRRR